MVGLFFFFFNDTATTEIYTLSLHDALPISLKGSVIPLTRNPVDPAGGYRYWSSIKPCES